MQERCRFEGHTARRRPHFGAPVAAQLPGRLGLGESHKGRRLRHRELRLGLGAYPGRRTGGAAPGLRKRGAKKVSVSSLVLVLTCESCEQQLDCHGQEVQEVWHQEAIGQCERAEAWRVLVPVDNDHGRRRAGRQKTDEEGKHATRIHRPQS